jgi:hypothetical protein
MTRITQGMISNDVVSGIMANGTRLDQIMTQLSTGKAINQPSDDPVGVTQRPPAAAPSRPRSTTSTTANMQDGDAWLSTADTAMQSGNNVLQSANELAIQGANGTYGADRPFRHELPGPVARRPDAVHLQHHPERTVRLLRERRPTRPSVQPGPRNGHHQIRRADANGTSLTTVPGHGPALRHRPERLQHHDGEPVVLRCASGHVEDFRTHRGNRLHRGLQERHGDLQHGRGDHPRGGHRNLGPVRLDPAFGKGHVGKRHPPDATGLGRPGQRRRGHRVRIQVADQRVRLADRPDAGPAHQRPDQDPIVDVRGAGQPHPAPAGADHGGFEGRTCSSRASRRTAATPSRSPPTPTTWRPSTTPRSRANTRTCRPSTRRPSRWGRRSSNPRWLRSCKVRGTCL